MYNVCIHIVRLLTYLLHVDVVHELGAMAELVLDAGLDSGQQHPHTVLQAHAVTALDGGW